MTTELVSEAGLSTDGEGQRGLDVSVVLPCLDEESSVGPCVNEALDAIAAAGWSGEVVVVDNGCTDRSAEIATAAGARVVCEPVAGYGAALLRGIGSARGEVVVMADADSTYPLDRLAEVVQPIRDGLADIMVGSRLEAATNRSMPILHRLIGTPVLTWLVREGTGAIEVSDSQSGFRAFRKDVFDELGLRSTGMEFASEMLIRAAQKDVVVREVPLGYRDRLGESKLSTWRDGMRHLRLILRLSPHVLLWKPGIAAMVLGILTYGLGLANPSGTRIRGVTWQPVFFGTTLLVLGLLALLSGAMLARHSPSASKHTREAFAWVDSPRFLTAGPTIGLAMLVLGLALDAFLFGEWIWFSQLGTPLSLQLAALAQGLALTGTILAVVVAVHRMLLREFKGLPPASPSPSGPLT